jgi:hypothetical protein
MKKLLQKLALPILMALAIASCSKTDIKESATSTQTGIVPHVYGLLPTPDAAVSTLPVFSPSIFNKGVTPDGSVYPGTLPSSYLITTPAIRDQGQIGSCTGFCGTEANEILKYYAKGGTRPDQTTITSTSGAMAAIVSNKFSNPSNYFGADGSLAPLFLYYIERVNIENYSITSDPGANMVNIGQALQGLTNNSGSGAPITPNGESTEDLYPYPITLNSQGYNVATASSTQFTTPPSPGAISNAANFIIGPQSGSTGTSGTTSAGYYYIPGTGDVAEVNNCKYAILNNKPVLMGFTVYDNHNYTVFEGLNTSSYIYNPLTRGTLSKGLRALGGHAVPLVGYFDDGTGSGSTTGGGYFIVQNSWGTPWGYHGHFLLPYSVLKNSKVVGNNNLFVLVQ